MLQFLTVDEVVAVLRVSRDTVYRLVAAGELPGRKVGRQWRFSREDIERYMSRSRSEDDAGTGSASVRDG